MRSLLFREMPCFLFLVLQTIRLHSFFLLAEALSPGASTPICLISFQRNYQRSPIDNSLPKQLRKKTYMQFILVTYSKMNQKMGQRVFFLLQWSLNNHYKLVQVERSNLKPSKDYMNPFLGKREVFYP